MSSVGPEASLKRAKRGSTGQQGDNQAPSDGSNCARNEGSKAEVPAKRTRRSLLLAAGRIKKLFISNENSRHQGCD